MSSYTPVSKRFTVVRATSTKKAGYINGVEVPTVSDRLRAFEVKARLLPSGNSRLIVPHEGSKIPEPEIPLTPCRR